MNATQNKRYTVILYFTFLAALFSACSTQSQDNQQTPIKDKIPVIDHKIDTTLRLNFPSGIRSILEDRKGNFWFGSHQEGVCLFDGKKLTYFTTDDGLSHNQIRSIVEDSNGMVWFEGGTGLSSYDGKNIIKRTGKNYGLNNEWQIQPQSEWRSRKNDLWFKGDETWRENAFEKQFGVYRYDGNTLHYHVFPLVIEEEDHWSYSISTPFIKGKNGMVWFSTYEAVIGYDGVSFRVIDDKSLGFNKETGNLHVRSLFEDSKGRLWIGNNGIGVLLYDGDTTINFSALQGLISENSLRRGGYYSPPKSLEHVFAIGEDQNGNIWFGDRDTGAWRYDGKSMKNYTKKDGLTSTFIWHIYNTKKGELWFAMADGSVLRFNGESFERMF